jgi:hypothetical protein
MCHDDRVSRGDEFVNGEQTREIQPRPSWRGDAHAVVHYDLTRLEGQAVANHVPAPGLSG